MARGHRRDPRPAEAAQVEEEVALLGECPRGGGEEEGEAAQGGGGGGEAQQRGGGRGCIPGCILWR